MRSYLEWVLNIEVFAFGMLRTSLTDLHLSSDDCPQEIAVPSWRIKNRLRRNRSTSREPDSSTCVFISFPICPVRRAHAAFLFRTRLRSLAAIEIRPAN